MDKVTQQARELYDEYRVGHYSYGNKREKFDPFLFEFLSRLDKTKTLVDVGCGSGFWLDSYVRYGWEAGKLTGIDLSPRNTESIKFRGYQGLCADVLNLPVADNAYDYAITNGVIHHTPDPLKAFREIVRIVKPSGLIYCSVYNAANPYYYVVHKATFWLRYIYWQHDRRILNPIYRLVGPLIRLAGRLLFGEWLAEETVKTIFMDQVMTPRAFLFFKRTMHNYCAQCGCRVIKIKYTKRFLMVTAVLQKEAERK